MSNKHIAISGELGSGKSSVANLLANSYGLKVLSTGQIQRSVAESTGLSTLEVNRLAEHDEKIDARIDGTLVQLGSSETAVVFDSRLAWHFVPSAFKIHLLVDQEVAAQRLYKARSSAVETYGSVQEARHGAEERYQSERRRFISKYGIDVSRLKNYDLVIDASDASVKEIFSEIQSVLEGDAWQGPSLRVSPRRVVPTGNCIRELTRDDESHWGHPVVGYARPFLFALRGHAALSEAIRSGRKLAPAFLEVEADEEVVGGMSAAEYLRREARPSWIYDWEDAHAFRFSHYPEMEYS